MKQIIQKRPAPPVKIGPSDLIRGEMLIRLIADYKEYDKRQKAYTARILADYNSLAKKYSEATSTELALENQELKRQLENIGRRVCQHRKMITALQCKVNRLKKLQN